MSKGAVTRVVRLEISVFIPIFPEISWIFYLCQSAVSKYSITFRKNNLFYARILGISVNSTENYGRYNFTGFC